MASKGPPPGYAPNQAHPPPQGGYYSGPNQGPYPQGPPPPGYPSYPPPPQGHCAQETTYVVVNSHNCPHCHCGTMHETTHVMGVVLAVLFYFFIGPFSLLFLLWRCERCSHCGYTI